MPYVRNTKTYCKQILNVDSRNKSFAFSVDHVKTLFIAIHVGRIQRYTFDSCCRFRLSNVLLVTDFIAIKI